MTDDRTLTSFADGVRDLSAAAEAAALPADLWHREYLPDDPGQPECIALTVWTVDDTSASQVLGVQFRWRARDVAHLDAIDDALRRVWRNRASGTVGSVRTSQVQWSSGASLGWDNRDRPMRSATYYAFTERL